MRPDGYSRRPRNLPVNPEPDSLRLRAAQIRTGLLHVHNPGWEGSVLWHSTSNPYRPGHKRKNWFVGVHFIDDLKLPEIDERDIVYSACRSGGNGGQNVNKVETSIRATHLPSGISVRCSDERSQFQNKQTAKRRLMLKLLDMQEESRNKSEKENWRKKAETNLKRRTGQGTTH